MNLQKELRHATRAFVRSGGKINRRMQLNRMESFVKHCREMGANSLKQVGKRHVMSFYEKHEHLASSTLLNHYYAIRQLFRLSLLPDPPKPEANPAARTDNSK